MQYYKCSSAILEMDLKAATLQVYHFLAAHANFRTRECWYGKKTIAARLNISESSVRRATKELETKGLLKIEEQFQTLPNQKRRQTTNLYTLLDEPQTHIEAPVKQQKKNKGLFSINCHMKAVQGKIKGVALKVYTYLESMTPRKRACSLSVEEIAHACRICVTSVRNALKLLTKKNLLQMNAKKAISKWGKQQHAKNQCLLPSFDFLPLHDMGVLHSMTPHRTNSLYNNTNKENFNKVCLNIDTDKKRNTTPYQKKQEQIYKIIDIFKD